MDRTSLKKQVHWIMLHFGMRALLEEVIAELKDTHNEEYVRDLRANLEKTLEEYEGRYGK